MTQVCSLLSSTADVNDKDNNKRLPKGINIVGTDGKSGPRVEGMPASEKEDSPWGYLFIQHFAAESFDRKLEVLRQSEGFVPRCFIHRSVTYKRRPNGKGVMKEEKPSVSGLVFLQGETRDLQTFLQNYFPQYHLVNNCATGRPASIPHSIMTPFMMVMQTSPERITFLRDHFAKFKKDHVRLRVLTGPFSGQEGYVVRIMRDRQLVIDLGGYAVAISNVHKEDFEIAE